MPIGPTKTKAQKKNVVKGEMHKFGEGKLHSGSTEGPVVTNPKQAIAISLHESGQSKKKPVKEKNYDRSAHQPGNPGFKREGKAPYADYNGGAHAKQPHGKSIGIHDGPEGHSGQSFEGEEREHWGSKTGHGEHTGKPVANVGTEKRGTELVGETNDGHAKQPGGKSLGAGRTDIAEHHMGHGMGPAHSFKMPTATNAHMFPGTHKSGMHRVSGHSGAHRIGKR